MFRITSSLLNRTMVARRTSVKTFMGDAKTELQSAIKNSKPVTFVVGNESADLDSLICSIVYAYLRTSTSSTSGPNGPYIPLANLLRADLALRPELSPVLARANLTPSDLITLSDLVLLSDSASASGAVPNSSPTPENASWILVDHNALTGELKKRYAGEGGPKKSTILGCIDHHIDEHFIPLQASKEGQEPRIIEVVGSCASLVVSHFQDAWSQQSSSSSATGTIEAEEARENSAEIAQLALAPILVDTTNLGSSKTTPTDTAAVAFLDSLLPSFDRAAYFDAITAAKAEIGELALHDILRKDYKHWVAGGVDIGIACVVRPLVFLRDKKTDSDMARLIEEMREYGRSRELGVLAVMTTSLSGEGGKFRRELLVAAVNKEEGLGVEVINAFLKKDAEKELGLQDLDLGVKGKGVDGVWVWEQKELGKSRKQIGPLLREAAEATASDGGGK